MRKPCRWPRCPALVDGGVAYCAEHRHKVAVQDVRRRGHAASRGYDVEWRALRNAYLSSNPWCERCRVRGVLRRAETVHHKVPLPHGPRLDTANLEALCNRCHRKEHAHAS